MKIVVMYVVVFGVLAFFIYGRSESPNPPKALDPIELLHPDYGWYWPEGYSGPELSYWFYERTEHSDQAVLAVNFTGPNGFRYYPDFPLEFRPTCISGPSNDSNRVLVGGYNAAKQAVLVELEFDFSSGKPVLLKQENFGDTSGLSVISDFRFEGGLEDESVVVLDGQQGRFVRIFQRADPVSLVGDSISSQLQGLQCIRSYSVEDGYELYELYEYHQDIHARYREGRTFVLKSSLEEGSGLGGI